MNAQRIYQLLLLLYPKSFRQRYGAAMTETFIDFHRHADRRGLGFWMFLLSDTMCAASLQHVERWASDDHRVAVRWLAACTAGTVLCNLVGAALMWSFNYLYHPYLEGWAFPPSLYGALLGVTLGVTQSLMFTRGGERAMWIAVSAMSAAAGLELATWSAVVTVTGPIGYGVVIGAVVANAQWLALRGRMKRPTAAVLSSAIDVTVAAAVGGVALTRALAGLNALSVPPGSSAAAAVLANPLYAPMNWTECLSAVVSTAVAGLVLGAITVRPASSLFVRAH